MILLYILHYHGVEHILYHKSLCPVVLGIFSSFSTLAHDLRIVIIADFPTNYYQVLKVIRKFYSATVLPIHAV